jgi:GMP synthase-like glutamine amidotransferase
VKLDEGDAVPDSSGTFAGSRSWAADERERRAAVDRAGAGADARRRRREVPVIGHCLGGQLLARALGPR